MWESIMASRWYDSFTRFMNDNLFLTMVVIIGFILLIAALVYLRRSWRIYKWAKSLGLRFSIFRSGKFSDEHPGFHCLKGEGSDAYNIAFGNLNGWYVWAFDFKRITHIGWQTNTTYFSGVLVRATFPLKRLVIREEVFSDRLADFIGKGDIDFESAEFSDKFYVSADDRKWAYDVLHPRSIEFLMTHDAELFEIKFSQFEVLVTMKQKIMKISQFEPALSIATTLLSMIPQYARQGESVTV